MSTAEDKECLMAFLENVLDVSPELRQLALHQEWDAFARHVSTTLGVETRLLKEVIREESEYLLDVASNAEAVFEPVVPESEASDRSEGDGNEDVTTDVAEVQQPTAGAVSGLYEGRSDTSVHSRHEERRVQKTAEREADREERHQQQEEVHGKEASKRYRIQRRHVMNPAREEAQPIESRRAVDDVLEMLGLAMDDGVEQRLTKEARQTDEE
ncbi:hypothetical protein Agub_g3664, partial [Astrephomene gubernaculifera]